MWREITGEAPPPSPVDARTYTAHGSPWFSLYDEHLGDLPAAGPLAGVRSVARKDAEHGFVGLDDNDPVDVPAGQVRGLRVRHPNGVPDGDW